MKKTFLSLLAIVAIATWSCQSEKEYLGTETTPGEVVTISLSPVLPTGIAGIKPLSSGNGGATELDDDLYDLRYIFEVYDNGALVGTRQVKIVDEFQTAVNVTFEASLPPKQYQFVFWADFVEEGASDNPTVDTDLIYETSNGLTDIEWTPDGGIYVIGDNRRDAYYAVEPIDLTGPVNPDPIELRRPFGKLRILATDVTQYLTDNPTVTLGKATLTYTTPTTFAKNFNARTGATGTETISTSGAHTFTPIPENVTVAGVNYSNAYLLAFDYFFVPADPSITFDIELFDNADNSLASKRVTNAPVGVNKLTTVLGDVFTTYDADLVVSIQDGFDNEATPGFIFLAGTSAEKVVVDHTAPTDAALTFTWTDAGFAGYDVLFSAGADMSYPVTVATNVSTNSYTITNDALQAYIGTTLAPKTYKKNTVYWTVKANGKDVTAPAAGSFNLYGQRIMVDRRRDVIHAMWPTDTEAHESLNDEPARTYKVAVLEYDGAEHVWLAEDLQTTAPMSPWAHWGGDVSKFTLADDGTQVTNESNCTTTPLPAAYLNRIDPPAGVYYHGVYLDDMLQPLAAGQAWPPSANSSWQLPTEDQFTKLFEAAVAEFGTDIGLRHPDFVTGDKARANEWGMNFVPNGVFSWGGSGSCNGTAHYIWNDNDIYYIYKNANGAGPSTSSGNYYRWWGSGYNITGFGNGANVRLIYIGDE